MKIFKISVFIIFVLFVSCKPTSETRNSKLSSNTLIPESGIIYGLPKTNLSFKVEAIKTDIFPGPYHDYAEKYIGLEEVAHNQKSNWQITNITIESYNDLDSEHLYVIEPTGKMKINLESLIKNQLVYPINKNVSGLYENQFYGKSEDGKDIVFKDLSVTKYVGEEQITYFKRVQRDSIFAKVPVVKTQSVYKSFEDKAEEAANFIFMIREKRFELLTGMADYYPDGKALEVALDELNRLENEYLDLFIGKSFSSTYTASFEFCPTTKDLNQPNILFRFSEDKGVLPANDLTGRPIIIEIEEMNQIKDLSGILPNESSVEKPNYKNSIYYRVPDLAIVKVFDGSSLLASRKIKVEQFGEIILLPSIFLLDQEKFIEYYRENE